MLDLEMSAAEVMEMAAHPAGVPLAYESIGAGATALSLSTFCCRYYTLSTNHLEYYVMK